MNDEHYRERHTFASVNSKITPEGLKILEHAISCNNAVGTLVGYYDAQLSFLEVSDYLLENLGYSYESFMAFTGGSLRGILYGQEHYTDADRFSHIHGAGEGRLYTADGSPVSAHLYKADAVDAEGTPIWIISVRVDWEQENLSLMNEAIGSGPWYMDCDENGDIERVYWSHAFRKILGYRDILDFPNRMESWSDLLHPEDKPGILQRLQDAVHDRENKIKYNVEYRLRMQDGCYRWFRAIAEVSRRRNGTARRIAGVFVCIDTEKQQKTLVKQAEAFHRAFTKGNLCEYYVDLEKNSFAPLKSEQTPMSQYEKDATWDDFIRRMGENFFSPEYREQVLAFYDRAYLKKMVNELETGVNLECPIEINGEKRWVRNVVMRGEAEDSRFAIAFLRDITEAKQEAENRSSMLRHNRAMEHLVHKMSRVVDHFAVCDIENDRYDYVNMALDTGYPPTGRYSDFMRLVLAGFQTLPPLRPLSELLSGEVIRQELRRDEDSMKFEYCSRDESVYCMATFTPLEWEEEKLTKVLWTSVDITKAKLDEIAARKALTEAYQAADRANRAKTEFLSNMSHDIRTPMNAIVGMTAIAGANIDHPERVIECLGKITASSRHLLGLINEVLDMARIESGKVSLVEEEFNLSELVDNLVTMSRPLIEEHHHNFDVRLLGIEHEDVQGDSLRIQQVFLNFMSNAVKYTPDGGNITFAIREKPNGESGLGCYEFSIEDDGIGMTEEFQKIMFEPFTRADDHRTTKVQGTGLGMAIARNIVNMMNGDIRVESTPNRGTKVTVSIFLRLQDKSFDEARELQNLPVLVVDDDQACCESTVEVLTEIGMAAQWVGSGQEAVDLCYARHEEHRDFFAIIMDWKMPGMDGIEATRQIRRRVGSNVTIIVLTSYDYRDIEEEARQAGVDAFIEKPLFRSRLTATMKEIATGRTTRTARSYLESFSKADYRGKRILLVEDNALNREIAEEILHMTGVEVDAAENGREACEKVSTSPAGTYDLIFMDIQMPVMNGYEATAAIRSLKGRRGSIPIIAMTANAFAEDVMMAKNTGMNEHIAKPLDMDKLSEILKKWL